MNDASMKIMKWSVDMQISVEKAIDDNVDIEEQKI